MRAHPIQHSNAYQEAILRGVLKFCQPTYFGTGSKRDRAKAKAARAARRVTRRTR